MPISVIVPARNEERNLEGVISILLELPTIQEIVICEGNSQDRTWNVAQELASRHPSKVRAIQQDGKYKFNAVICALRITTCDQIMIWDADNTVDIADQNVLIDAAESHPNSLYTGDRLKGVREKHSMRFFNLIGNHLFAFAWSPFLRTRTDTLCGSKIFPRNILDSCPSKILDTDPFGDFSFLAAAYFSGIGVKGIPVHYLPRSYGETNIHRWSNGLQLLSIYLVFISINLINLFKKNV